MLYCGDVFLVFKCQITVSKLIYLERYFCFMDLMIARNVILCCGKGERLQLSN